jgi:hypothetical protein
VPSIEDPFEVEGNQDHCKACKATVDSFEETEERALLMKVIHPMMHLQL